MRADLKWNNASLFYLNCAKIQQISIVNKNISELDVSLSILLKTLQKSIQASEIPETFFQGEIENVISPPNDWIVL